MPLRHDGCLYDRSVDMMGLVMFLMLYTFST